MTSKKIWKIELDKRAAKELRKLGRDAQSSIITYLEERVSTSDDPRQLGKEMKHDFKGLVRYRVGDYRIIASVSNNTLTVLVVRIGHRKKVYD